MSTTIDDLKGQGKMEEAGKLAASLGRDRWYGCHFGLKSNLSAAKEAFFKGYDSYEG